MEETISKERDHFHSFVYTLNSSEMSYILYLYSVFRVTLLLFDSIKAHLYSSEIANQLPMKIITEMCITFPVISVY